VTPVIDDIVAVNGVELFTRRFGDPSRPILIVIHGGPTWDHSYLLPAAAELADLAHVVLFDLRGCGRSSRTPPAGQLPVGSLQPDYLADDVGALIRHLGPGPADVLGFSYGGGIAMRVAEQHPSLLRRLILASTTAYPVTTGEPGGGIDLYDPALTGPDAPDGALSRAMAIQDASRSIWRHDRLAQWLEVIAGIRFSSDWNEPYAAGQLRPAAPEDPARALRTWGGPVLLLQGAHDFEFPVTVARRLHAEVPESTLAEIPDAAHQAHFDNPAAWLSAIRTFLTKPVSEPG
jgi:pimeloyl-ACP methyl ester carboxylesterase